MTQDELWEVSGVTVEQLLEDYDRERAASYRLAGHHTRHGVGKVAPHHERLAQAQRVKAARTKLLAALNTRATHPSPAGLAGETRGKLRHWLSSALVESQRLALITQFWGKGCADEARGHGLQIDVCTRILTSLTANASQPDRVVETNGHVVSVLREARLFVAYDLSAKHPHRPVVLRNIDALLTTLDAKDK